MRVLLLTNNVGKIFDALDVGLDWWLDILDNTITSTAADFIAVHLQELGGSAFVEGTATMESIKAFGEAVRRRFPDYWSSGLFAPSLLDVDFTALGCIVLVRRSLTKDVAVFDFGAGDGSGGWIPLSTLDDPLLADPGLPARWSRHSSFSRDLFDELESTWTRKGWLHTRWRVDRQPVDLLNVHLFDDVDQLKALRRGASALSPYAIRRHEALRLALQMLTGAGPAPAALGPLPPATFVFGDLNWRLDLRCVLSQLAGESIVASILSATGPGPSAGHQIAVPIQTAEALDEIAGGGAAANHCLSAWVEHITQCRCLAFGPPQRAIVEARRFWMDDDAVFARRPSTFRGCDLELAASRKLAPALEELDIAFPPTFSYSLGRDPGDRSAARATYDGKCCPSWCDRVLLDAIGMRLVRAASDYAYDVVHEQLRHSEAMNDHQMVHLVFTLAPSASLGMEPTPVHVKADVAAPVPIKVKCIAVGVG